jgi:hypothetical protein
MQTAVITAVALGGMLAMSKVGMSLWRRVSAR